MNSQRYQIVNKKSIEAGCGFRFDELRTYILDTVTDKIVRDIGAAKWSQNKAIEIAAALNAKNA